ncbi:pectate lyase-like adhesive domain-containing protein, partial [Vagococcus salmoninarum]
MNNKIGLVVLGLVLSVGLLVGYSSQKVNHVILGSSNQEETVYLTQLEAVEVGKTAQLGLQISSTIADQVRLQFPAETEFIGISEESDPQLEVVFEASSQQLIITTNKRKMLDEESETYNSSLYVKFKSDSSGDYLFKTLINNPQILTEEVLVSVQEIDALRTVRAITPRLVTNVSTWPQFNAALANSSVSEINLTDNIRATSSPTNVTRSLRINGHGYQLDLDNRTLILGNVNAPQSLTFNNLILAGRGSGSRINSSTSNSASWTLNLESLSFGSSIGTQNIFNLPQGRIAFTGGSSNLVSSVTDTSTSRGMLTAKILDVTNGAQVNGRLGGGFFFSNVSGTETTIDQGGQLVIHSETGLLFNQTNPSSFSVDGQNSLLQGTGNRQSAGDNGTLVSMIGPNSRIEVNNGGKIDIFATGTPAMLLNSQNGRFSVSNGSSLNLTSSGGANDRAATLRFRVNGGQTFLAESNSKINIRKIRGGTANSAAATAPAVRMRNPNNRFIVNSGGKVSVYNQGSGQPQNPGGVNRNQGILYTEGDNSQFELSGEGSVVEIDADFGAAIDTHNQTASISANEGTTFIARGRTASEGSGIFNTSRSTIALDKVRFFDFRNERPGGGNIFNVSGGSRLESVNSNLSVWRKGSHLDGDPDLKCTPCQGHNKKSGMNCVKM